MPSQGRSAVSGAVANGGRNLLVEAESPRKGYPTLHRGRGAHRFRLDQQDKENEFR